MTYIRSGIEITPIVETSPTVPITIADNITEPTTIPPVNISVSRVVEPVITLPPPIKILNDDDLDVHNTNMIISMWNGTRIQYRKDVRNTEIERYYPKGTTDRSAYLRRYRDHKKVYSEEINLEEYKQKKIFLIVVNFHFPFYKNTEFMDKLLFPAFARNFKYDFDLVMIGPYSNSTYHVISATIPKKGYYSYHSATVALRCYPLHEGFDYAGVIFMNDDSCVHPGRLTTYDLSRSLLESSSKWTKKIHWMWNYMRNDKNVPFKDAYENAIEELQTIEFIQNKCHFDVNDLHKGWSDFFYIAKKDIPYFLGIEAVMYKHRVFLENAVPSTMLCLGAQKIINCNHNGLANLQTCLHLHPTKFSKANSRQLCLGRIQTRSR